MKRHLLALLVVALMGCAQAYAELEVKVTANPANEAQLTALTEFDLIFDQPMKADWPEAVEVLRDGRKVCGVTVSFSDASKVVTVHLTQPQTQEGTYTFHHLDWAACPKDEAYATPHIDLTYYIGEPRELEPVVSTSPWEDQRISSLSGIMINFENVKTLEINPEKSVVLTDGVDTYPYYLLKSDDREYTNVYAMPVEEGLVITKCGEYRLVIEDGALVLNGRPYGYTFTFTISVAPVIVAIDPAEGETTVDALKHITLTMSKEITGIRTYMVHACQLYKCDDEGNLASSVAGYDVAIDPQDRCKVHLTAIDDEVDIDENGVYSLAIPPTLMSDGRESNTAEAIHYVISNIGGISAVTAADGRVDAYSIGGVKLIDGGSRESVRALRPGIYIINGKTTVIK